MKFFTHIKETIKGNLSHQSFQKKIKSWNFNHMILKCSFVHYGMTMLMFMTLSRGYVRLYMLA
jgi:hypothetical protein